MNIKTLNNESMYVDNKITYSIVESEPHYPHWGWAVAAILFMWPLIALWLIVGWTRKKYNVNITKNGFTVTVWLDKENFELLEKTAKAK